jgi:gas vesicle protein
MTSFLYGALAGLLTGGFVGFIASALISANRAGAFQQAADDESQVQALLDYQSMTALEEEFMFAKTAS